MIAYQQIGIVGLIISSHVMLAWEYKRVLLWRLQSEWILYAWNRKIDAGFCECYSQNKSI